MDHAPSVVEGVVVDHETRMGRALEYLHEFAESDVALHRDDVGAWNHDIHDAPLAQTEDVLEHGALGRGKAGFARTVLEHIL